MTEKEKLISQRIAVVFSILILFLLKVWIIQLIWNWLITGLVGLPEISLIQAMGLRILGVLMTLDGSKNQEEWKERWNKID